MPRSSRLVHRVVPVLGLTLGFAIALAACSGSPASAAPVTSVPSGLIALDAKEYAFTPSALTAPAGSLTFAIRNTGREPTTSSA